MATILDGRALSKKIKEGLKSEVEELNKKGIYPKLAVIMVGEDPSSKIYVRNKSISCNEVGIKYEEHLLSDKTTMKKLLDLIHKLNEDDSVNGILLQSPIPKGLDINEAFKNINPLKDVDGFNPYNVGKLCLGQDSFIPCTPYGVIKLLEEYNIEIQAKNAVIVGRSNIVGKPMMQCLLNKNATVTICHSKTVNLAEMTKQAEILVVAVGKPRLITENMVKKGVVIVDVGINRGGDGKLCGDVDFDEVKNIASYITPVPGGVGPMTIAMLMNNIIKATKLQNK